MKKRYMILSVIWIIVLWIILFVNFHPVFWSKATWMDVSKNYKDGKFWNFDTSVWIETWTWSMLDMIKEYWNNDEERFPLKTIPTVKFDKQNFKDWDFVWFGHSTILMRVDGKNILIDPVFYKASPIFFGWKAFNYSDMPEISDLPEIDILLISHDHYDHLDYKSILELKSKTKKYLVGLGVKAHLEWWGIESDNVVEFDWYDEEKVNDINIVYTPAQHFSGRWLTDRFSTLWWWWVIKWKESNIYFSWDSWYFDEFKNIWEKYWPFDIAFIENGAYDEMWSSIHMMPEEVVQAWIDIKAKQIVPVHWGKFDLALHSWYEPIDRFINEADKKWVKYIHPKVWEIFNNSDISKQNWWKDLITK